VLFRTNRVVHRAEARNVQGVVPADETTLIFLPIRISDGFRHAVGYGGAGKHMASLGN